jgi:hypothetical protein
MTDFSGRRGKRMRKFSGLILSVLLLISAAQAQQAEVTIQLNEQFFEALLDAIFKNTSPPEFPLAEIREKEKGRTGEGEKTAFSNAFVEIENRKSKTENPASVCPDSIKLQREIDGTKTAVRFREGRVVAPIAFTGNYNPPLIGCIDFSGVAETAIDLEFDAQKQALIGRAKVLDVNLSGTGGVGSAFLARMVQGSIDKKINPIQILAMEKISFVVPIQNAGSLKMKANGIRHEIANGVLNVRISYEFQKAN